jgi:hypothetical protein
MAIVGAVKQNVKLGCLTVTPVCQEADWHSGHYSTLLILRSYIAVEILLSHSVKFPVDRDMKSRCFLSTLKVEVITASESFVHTYQYMRRYIPEDRNL